MAGRRAAEPPPIQASVTMDDHKIDYPVNQPLTRTVHDRMIAGVCGGIARWLGWNSTAVRLIYVLISVCSVAFPGIIVYLILALVMPLEQD